MEQSLSFNESLVQHGEIQTGYEIQQQERSEGEIQLTNEGEPNFQAFAAEEEGGTPKNGEAAKGFISDNVVNLSNRMLTTDQIKLLFRAYR